METQTENWKRIHTSVCGWEAGQLKIFPESDDLIAKYFPGKQTTRGLRENHEKISRFLAKWIREREREREREERRKAALVLLSVS